MDMDLQIKIRKIDDIPVMDLSGEVDAYTCSRLREAMIEVIDDGGSDLVVNMKDVEYIDSSGLGTLVGGLKRVSERQGSIAVCGTNSQIKKVFDITGLVKVFPLFSDEQEAIKNIKSRNNKSANKN